jgi:hypothetical protein
VRRLLVLALGALLVAPAPPSRSAGLGADVLVTGEAHFNIYGSDRVAYLVDLVAKSSEAGSRAGTGSAAFTVRRCAGARCTKPVTYAGALPAGSFTVAQDLSSGYLAADWFGRRVVLTWAGTQGSPLPSYELKGDGPTAAVRLSQVTAAGGLLLGKQCVSKNGLVSRSVRVDADATPSRPLPRAVPRWLTGMVKGQCSRPVA